MPYDVVPGKSMKSPRSPRKPSPNDESHLLSLQQEFPYQVCIDKTEYRGITMRQLKRVIDFSSKNCGKWRDLTAPERSRTAGHTIAMSFMNLYMLNDWVIRPGTLKNNCAFVELLARTVQKPDWFVSHWWGEAIYEFMLCISKHVAVRGETADVAYWVCAYANRQHSLAQEIHADPRETSFFRAMCLSKGVLLILDGIGPATPFKRIWCAFEESVLMQGTTTTEAVLLDIVTVTGKTEETKKAELLTDGITAVDDDGFHKVGGPEQAKAQREATFPIRIIKEGLRLELEKAEATNEEDRIHILNALAERDINAKPPLETHDNYTKINRRLRAIFAVAAWRQAAEQKGGSIVRELGLSEVVASDVWRDSLALNFAFCKMQDNDIADVAGGIHKSLRILNLDFRRCLSVGDDGLESLALALPKTLDAFKLNCTGCRKLKGPGLIVLAQQLPDDLKVLELNFYGCPQINQQAVATIGASLTASLEELDVNFSWCEQICNPCVASFVNHMPTTLQKVALNFRKTGVTEDVLDAIRDLMAACGDESDSPNQGAVDDAPGKYVVVRDNPTFLPEDDGDEKQSPPLDLSVGAQIDIKQVKYDPDTSQVLGKIIAPSGWVLMLDCLKRCRWVALDKPDALGKYVILKDKTEVGFEAERIGGAAGVLNKGDTVEVKQIKICRKIQRVRGHIVKPHGWISLQNTQTGQRLAANLPDTEKFATSVLEKAHRSGNVPLKEGIDKLTLLCRKKLGPIRQVEQNLGIDGKAMVRVTRHATAAASAGTAASGMTTYPTAHASAGTAASGVTTSSGETVATTPEKKAACKGKKKAVPVKAKTSPGKEEHPQEETSEDDDKAHSRHSNSEPTEAVPHANLHKLLEEEDDDEVIVVKPGHTQPRGTYVNGVDSPVRPSGSPEEVRSSKALLQKDKADSEKKKCECVVQ